MEFAKLHSRFRICTGKISMGSEREFSGLPSDSRASSFCWVLFKFGCTLSTCFRWTRILKLRNFPLAGRPLVVESGPWSSVNRFGETFVESLLHILNSDYSLKNSLAFSQVLRQLFLWIYDGVTRTFLTKISVWMNVESCPNFIYVVMTMVYFRSSFLSEDDGPSKRANSHIPSHERTFFLIVWFPIFF